VTEFVFAVFVPSDRALLSKREEFLPMSWVEKLLVLSFL